MQRLYDIVQPRSNIPLENDDLLHTYDLETKLALVMNTKVVPSNILNMFKVFLRFHKHFYTLVTYKYFLGQQACHHLGA